MSQSHLATLSATQMMTRDQLILLSEMPLFSLDHGQLGRRSAISTASRAQLKSMSIRQLLLVTGSPAQCDQLGHSHVVRGALRISMV